MTEIPKILKILYSKLIQQKTEREHTLEQLLNVPSLNEYDDLNFLLEKIGTLNNSIELLENMMSNLHINNKESNNG